LRSTRANAYALTRSLNGGPESATPRMSFGHLLLALALTGYVLIAMRYEERDLLHQFGGRYRRWRGRRRSWLEACEATSPPGRILQTSFLFTSFSMARSAQRHFSPRRMSRSGEILPN
jgi:hypothetical protein